VEGETNVAMRRGLGGDGGLLRQQYDTAARNLRTTVQQLNTSQLIIQVGYSS